MDQRECTGLRNGNEGFTPGGSNQPGSDVGSTFVQLCSWLVVKNAAIDTIALSRFFAPNPSAADCWAFAGQQSVAQ